MSSIRRTCRARRARVQQPVAGARGVKPLLAGGVVAAFVAAAAAPVRVAPADEPGPAAAYSTRVDVDGDGRADHTQLKKVGVRGSDYIFRLTTRTATKRTFSTDIRVPRERDDLTASDVWVGAAGVDGVRGGEVIVDRGGGVGDFPYSFVYTVRKGKWQLLLAPGAKSTKTNWSIGYHPAMVSGYEFTMNRGIRRVTATQLQWSSGDWDEPLYSGKRVTYRWVSGQWKHSGTLDVKDVPDKQAREWSGWNGLIWRR